MKTGMFCFVYNNKRCFLFKTFLKKSLTLPIALPKDLIALSVLSSEDSQEPDSEDSPGRHFLRLEDWESEDDQDEDQVF